MTEKPDAVWDRPDLDRLCARLEDEYELRERTETLTRKLAVIADTAEVLTDIIDTRRSLRLEISSLCADRGSSCVVAGYQTAYQAITLASHSEGWPEAAGSSVFPSITSQPRRAFAISFRPSLFRTLSHTLTRKGRLDKS